MIQFALSIANEILIFIGIFFITLLIILWRQYRQKKLAKRVYWEPDADPQKVELIKTNHYTKPEGRI